MKVLITGAKGMLGRSLCQTLTDFDVIATDRDTMDITDADAVGKVVRMHRPDAVIHCAAMTAVDLCETERDKAFQVNAFGTANVAEACNLYGARLISISTDYVFDGDAEEPYNEFDAPSGGRTVYGQSKWAGEEAIRRIIPVNHVICRVAWLYGGGGPSFVHTMLRLADGTRSVLKVVNDQLGNPTSTDAVASAIAEILESPLILGTLHLSCEGEATWYEFAKKIFEIKKIPQVVVPCTSNEYPRPAPRPRNSRLEKTKLRLYGLSPMPRWDDELQRVLSHPNF